jgi:ribosomal protein L29
MELKELRQKQEGELNKLLAQQREALRDLRFKVASKQHKDVRDVRSTKQTIARIATVIKEKMVLRDFAKKINKQEKK